MPSGSRSNKFDKNSSGDLRLDPLRQPTKVAEVHRDDDLRARFDGDGNDVPIVSTVLVYRLSPSSHR